MNAEELWDTTMDPAHRVLLQVTLDDAAARRRPVLRPDGRGRRGSAARFIQRNAKDVRFLDI